ncbi:MAG: transposase [Acidobacteria bacterium]|nr:transposase [Acidobacteriota bacterium]
MDRRYFNRFGDPKIKSDEEMKEKRERLMKSRSFQLDSKRRLIVNRAIREVCLFLKVTLYALNVRSNHVHLVVANDGGSPERLMTRFKAYATRSLRTSGLVPKDAKVWSRHGSTKYLWTEGDISEAIRYVELEQGDDLDKRDHDRV